jgi:2-polyprenyl-6-methoxyphenol hydroxylase-like FAD-dependent oxidoreductase
VLAAVSAAYETERRPVAAAVVTMTDRLTRAATARNPWARQLRNTVLSLAGRSSTVQRKLAMNLSELSTAGNRTGHAGRLAGATEVS